VPRVPLKERPIMVQRIALAFLLAAAISGEAAAENAKTLFSSVPAPSAEAPAPHGRHAGGCVAGAVALPESGPGWQALRLSRNRNWGHPDTIATLRRIGGAARALGWRHGVLVGDISQPRGGPMPSGHASHQSGLDADIWFRRPERRYSVAERESLSAIPMVAPDRVRVSAAFTPSHAALLKAAAAEPKVTRIFVNAAIKAELCRSEPAAARGWLRKLRPWWGHDSHFHIRLACPAGAAGCEDQAPPPPGDGCDDTLAWWFSDEALNPAPSPAPAKPRPQPTLADLPAACARTLRAPG
jgi:penicillin-insensitive murein endopeptidase